MCKGRDCRGHSLRDSHQPSEPGADAREGRAQHLHQRILPRHCSRSVAEALVCIAGSTLGHTRIGCLHKSCAPIDRLFHPSFFSPSGRPSLPRACAHSGIRCTAVCMVLAKVCLCARRASHALSFCCIRRRGISGIAAAGNGSLRIRVEDCGWLEWLLNQTPAHTVLAFKRAFGYSIGATAGRGEEEVLALELVVVPWFGWCRWCSLCFLRTTTCFRLHLT